MRKIIISLLLCTIFSLTMSAKDKKDYVPEPYTWTSQSKNSSESMPLGGHDVGMNVWVENGDVMVYLSRSGYFDENNTLLKAGRLRLHIEDAAGGMPLNGNDFQQTLSLDEGCMYIKGGGVTLRLWADVNSPVVFADLKSGKKVNATLSYESWRHKDRDVSKAECQQFSWKWLTKGDKPTFADSITAKDAAITFVHHNRLETVRDFTIDYEQLSEVKDLIPDPIGGRSFGGRMSCPGFRFVGTHEGTYTSTDYKAWDYKADGIKATTITIELKDADRNKQIEWGSGVPAVAKSQKASAGWWHNFWQRSYIKSNHPEARKLIRNYELFRYMLGCNAKGQWPTKFNGGLFTFDPVYEREDATFTPDYRAWGGGTMTAQNQRLVYWPMLKSGDVDMMQSQFDAYLYMLPAAQARVRHYWRHAGALFEEQLENFGLPNPAEYGKHKEGEDPSWMRNKWLEYTWDTSLEFCQMILLANEYSGMDISKYRTLITECIRFFDEHYQYLAKQRGSVALDENGKLVIYPASGCETYKMAYNPSSTVAALQCVLKTIDERHGGLEAWGLDSTLLSRVPEIPTRIVDGKKMIAPAVAWMRIQNIETPQLYPVFPWRIYGLGRPDLDVARNTYLYDDFAVKMHSSKGWKQDNIWAPILGLEDEAVRLNKEKLADGPYRFPAFWERGFDWSPDHNHGGSGMIGLQEMLLQEDANGELMLFPCWPKDWDCEFRLNATGGRVVEGDLPPAPSSQDGE